MRKKLSPGFYFRYVWNTGRKNRFGKWLITIACAGAVAFAAIGIGQFSDYLGMLDGFMKNISDRELVIFHDSYAGNQFDNMNLPIAAEKVDELKRITGVSQIEPLFLFSSKAQPYSRKYYANELADDFIMKDSSIVCANIDGLETETMFDADSGEDYVVLSYPNEEKMERTALYLDDLVEEGVYLTESFMKCLGLEVNDLNGLTITFDVWVLTAHREEIMLITDYSENGATEESELLASVPFSQKLTLTEKVKGILPEAYYDQVSNACIYMSAQKMEQVLETCPKDYEAMEYITNYLKEINPDKTVEDFSDWNPNAYYVIVESAENVEAVKESIENLDPNFTVLHEYQNVEDSIRIISENRNLMIYITFAILAIVLLLMDLIYVSLIDKRQYEFAVLRANGMTKLEVRNTIYLEMLLQFLKVFVLSIGLAFVVYYVGRRWYAFQFDWVTVLWLFVISLGSLLLPTIVSLFFVNKFEPDQIMRK